MENVGEDISEYCEDMHTNHNSAMQTKEPFMAVQVYSSTDKDVREGNAFLRCERRKYLQQLQTGSKYF